MFTLKDKVQNGLDETRILILGSQVLLGFQLRFFFATGYDSLPPSAQRLGVGGLLLLMIALTLLLSPGAFHLLAEDGEDTDRLLGFLQRTMLPIPLCFGGALAVSFHLAALKVFPTAVAATVGGAGLGTALFFFYGVEALQLLRASSSGKRSEAMTSPPQQTDLKDKIRQLLTEARVVLPGAQAVLGFQFSIFFTAAFAKLPEPMKVLHFLATLAVGLATVLLMTPAVYHRLVERGEDTPRFHRVASRFLLAAMAPLGLAACAEIFLVIQKVLDSGKLATLAALATGMLMVFLWVVYPLSRRR